MIPKSGIPLDLFSQLFAHPPQGPMRIFYHYLMPPALQPEASTSPGCRPGPSLDRFLKPVAKPEESRYAKTLKDDRAAEGFSSSPPEPTSRALIANLCPG
jgi:hypothetical protein